MQYHHMQKWFNTIMSTFITFYIPSHFVYSIIISFVQLVSDTGSEIHSTHETPVKHYVDDQSFTLSAGSGGAGSCTVAVS